MSINSERKDRVFKCLFGNPVKKAWTLALYNAVNSSSYNDPDAIQFNTLDDAIYLDMKNDISFIILSVLNLWEHQSSYKPNIPMRFLLYIAKLYEKYIANSDYYIYSRKLQMIPCPKCICFYNGTEEQPERQILKLSDAFIGNGDVEVTVTMLNINYGKNRQLMGSCEPLNEYAWLVESIREHQSKLKKEKVLAQAANDERKQTAMDMLRDGEPLAKIARYSRLAEETIRNLAGTPGVTVL